MIFTTPVQILRIQGDIVLDPARHRFATDKDEAYSELSIIKVPGEVDVENFGIIDDKGHGGEEKFRGTVTLQERSLKRFGVGELLLRDRLVIMEKTLDIVKIVKARLGYITVTFQESIPDETIVDVRHEEAQLV
jgi:hypothetical protein